MGGLVDVCLPNRVVLLASRLEEMNEKRQGLIQRLKVAEREKGALEGKKAEAEMFLAKQVGRGGGAGTPLAHGQWAVGAGHRWSGRDGSARARALRPCALLAHAGRDAAGAHLRHDHLHDADRGAHGRWL